ncbi:MULTISPECIES: sugar O-acetyltransferase [unclassified Lactococcus]|uniref:sugar O-acetyltransferase n=1 Tax=unclassified Lactococcus TaxID=2643510 RepID=UPI0011C6F1A8|nr:MULTISPECIES: sugar O-acetyltransferase [unclassified Lactococcus]MQW22538.1 sugar O-acetyltransferase [Lactococcus sp. dk101]TXK45689.1 sugar O-acetyltransferase [Lactococcus sp. dk310]TXK51530.1 sugar O-acetyltransferase [Lactococcus sp. dk322]
MHQGKLYFPEDKELWAEQIERQGLVETYNTISLSNEEERNKLLTKMFKDIGKGSFIHPPFYANWAGKFVTIGENLYANYNLTLVDDTFITIGNDVMIGPNVTIATASHPIHPELRSQGLQFNLEVSIGDKVWIGANTTVLPGVSIGKNSVIGAGSIVTKDIPENVVAYGNPCKVQREITDADLIFYYRQRRVDL